LTDAVNEGRLLPILSAFYPRKVYKGAQNRRFREYIQKKEMVEEAQKKE
jgi:hypothetical protein